MKAIRSLRKCALKYIWLGVRKVKTTFCFIILLAASAAFAENVSGVSPFSKQDKKIQKKTTHFFQVQLKHIDAAQAKKALESVEPGRDGLLSKKGRVIIDKAKNELLVFEESALRVPILHFIKGMDVPVKQVALQAYIVKADAHFSKELGIDFSGYSEHGGGAKKIKQSSFSFQKNKINFEVGKLGPGISLEVALNALEQQGRGRVLSSPRLVTSNEEAAYIGSGEEIPYQEKTTKGNTSIAFKKAVLSLEATPQIMPKNNIQLDLIVHQDNVSNLFINGVPAIHTQEIRTKVQVKNGQTLVLGGIFEVERNQKWARVPVLGDLPIVGKLFHYKVNRNVRRELLIFVTPTLNI